jgi:spore maturation protein SpmB
MLPSLYNSGNSDRAWNIAHAGCYGAVIGALAAMFKTLGPFRANAALDLTGNLMEIALATIGFASLCAAAAALRNFIARRLARYEG